MTADVSFSAAGPGSKVTSPTYKTDLASPSVVGECPTVHYNILKMQPFVGTKAKGYVTIDFDKTDALIKSANQRFFEVIFKS